MIRLDQGDMLLEIIPALSKFPTPHKSTGCVLVVTCRVSVQLLDDLITMPIVSNFVRPLSS